MPANYSIVNRLPKAHAEDIKTVITFLFLHTFTSKKIDPKNTNPYYSLFNIGNNQPEKLEDFIRAIEQAAGLQASKNYLPMQAGDVLQTYADVGQLQQAVHFKPATSLTQGMQLFVDWYRAYQQSASTHL